jgi:predicted transcriptional regulator
LVIFEDLVANFSLYQGAMLGNGIYFADTFAKSLNYSSEYYGDRQSTYRIMLLCEVALGPRQAVYQSNLEMQTENLDSMKGEGSNIPDPDNAVYDANGVSI